MDRESFVQNGVLKYNGGRSSLTGWFGTPIGRYVFDWECTQFDHATEDAFGYRAVQAGMPEVDFLRSNRIPFRFTLALEHGATVAADPLQLPLETGSMDLVVLPHTLETHTDPHQVLREAERALRPEGHLVISGFNPLSLWRLRQMFLRGTPPAPWDARFISLFQLRDWLRLLGFELTGGRFGCYAPPFTQPKWLARFGFMEQAGDRWWPIAGAVYVVRAIKRVHGTRMLTPAWRLERRRRRSLAAMPQRNGHPTRNATDGDEVDGRAR